MEEERKQTEPEELSRIEKRRMEMIERNRAEDEEQKYSDGGTEQLGGGVQIEREWVELVCNFLPPVIALFSLVLPWARISYMGEEVLTKTGLEIGGMVIAIISIIILVITFVFNGGFTRAIRFFSGISLTGIAIYYIFQVSGAKNSLQKQYADSGMDFTFFDFQIGIGIWLLLLSGILLVAIEYYRTEYN